MKTSAENQERKLQILVSETQRGTSIREKLGHILLWRKDTDIRNKIYVVEVRKLICQNKECNHLIELPMPLKIFRMMGEPTSHKQICDKCEQVHEYKFGEGQVKGIKV